VQNYIIFIYLEFEANIFDYFDPRVIRTRRRRKNPNLTILTF